MATSAGGEKDGKAEAKGDGKGRARQQRLQPLTQRAPRIAEVGPAERVGAAGGGAGSAAGAAGAGAAASTAPDGRAFEIALDKLERNPFQTRSHFDEALLDELAASIRAIGVIQPVLVRAIDGGRYQLIAGERRWLASQRAEKATIPAVVTVMNDTQAMEATIIENLQRADLNPMEQARAFDRLSREFKMTQDQMSVRTGKDRASISNFLRLLKLPQELQGAVEVGELSFGHARALLALDTHDQMARAAQKMQALAMNVRQAETFIKGIIDPERREAEKKQAALVDPNVREMENTLRSRLGLKVTIEDKLGRGRVVIEYANLEAFDGLVERLLGE
jgi:ParB family chromosome partitioning protein